MSSRTEMNLLGRASGEHGEAMSRARVAFSTIIQPRMKNLLIWQLAERRDLILSGFIWGLLECWTDHLSNLPLGQDNLQFCRAHVLFMSRIMAQPSRRTCAPKRNSQYFWKFNGNSQRARQGAKNDTTSHNTLINCITYTIAQGFLTQLARFYVCHLRFVINSSYWNHRKDS